MRLADCWTRRDPAVPIWTVELLPVDQVELGHVAGFMDAESAPWTHERSRLRVVRRKALEATQERVA